MKNWKTTLFGAISAAAIAAQSVYATGGVDLKTALTAIAVAVFGYLVKDAGVSGTGK